MELPDQRRILRSQINLISRSLIIVGMIIVIALYLLFNEQLIAIIGIVSWLALLQGVGIGFTHEKRHLNVIKFIVAIGLALTIVYFVKPGKEGWINVIYSGAAILISTPIGIWIGNSMYKKHLKEVAELEAISNQE